MALEGRKPHRNANGADAALPAPCDQPSLLLGLARPKRTSRALQGKRNSAARQPKAQGRGGANLRGAAASAAAPLPGPLRHAKLAALTCPAQESVRALAVASAAPPESGPAPQGRGGANPRRATAGPTAPLPGPLRHAKLAALA